MAHKIKSGYPVNQELRDSIESIFDDVSIGLGFLGVGVNFMPDGDGGIPLDQKGDPIERVQRLRIKLEEYVVQMGAELKELGEQDVSRIRAEATATLIFLREIKRYFPEAFDN
jgi:hypothetical protein